MGIRRATANCIDSRGTSGQGAGLLKKRSLYLEGRMDWRRVELNWNSVKPKVKEQWGKLTDDDLTVINGKLKLLEATIQKRYGLRKEEVRMFLERWYNAQRW
jgi:uncharacterized protein YjbJ (UPF0337 family)